MPDRFETVLFLAILTEWSVLVLALVLLMRPAFRSKAYWLLAYAITGLYSDYLIGIGAIDRALGYDGVLLRRVALPPTVNFILDFSGRIVLLIAIWLFFLHVMKAGRGNSTASRTN
jgi:hypothetical protein